jgi:hypothetical protein
LIESLALPDLASDALAVHIAPLQVLALQRVSGARCEHHACRCARTAELAAMGLTLEAIRVDGERVRCRMPGGAS